MFKAAEMMPVNVHRPFITVGRYLLMAFAIATTALCVAQQLGLLIVSFHWHVGWSVLDHVALTRDKNRRRLPSVACWHRPLFVRFVPRVLPLIQKIGRRSRMAPMTT
jgi:hypothetical protein